MYIYRDGKYSVMEHLGMHMYVNIYIMYLFACVCVCSVMW